MLNRTRRFTAVFCFVALMAGISLPHSAAAKDSFINSSDTEANNMTSPILVDLILLRPVGLLTMCVSSLFFVFPVAPITFLTRPSEIAKPWDLMVLEPARFVWVHPLGSH